MGGAQIVLRSLHNLWEEQLKEIHSDSTVGLKEVDTVHNTKAAALMHPEFSDVRLALMETKQCFYKHKSMLQG